MKNLLKITSIAIFAMLVSSCIEEEVLRTRVETITETETITVYQTDTVYVEGEDTPEYPVVNEANLVAYWNFNNNYDDQVGARTATLNNAIAYTDDRHGNSSFAFLGNGNVDGDNTDYADDNYFTVPADADILSTSATYSVWLKAPPRTGGATFVVSIPIAGDFWGALGIFQDGATNGTKFKSFSRHDSEQWFDKDGFPADEWFHLAWTYDETTGTRVVYVNGAVAYTDVISAGPLTYTVTETADKLYVGGTALAEPWAHSWAGLMDDLRIYKIALTAAEILEIYNNEV